MKIQLDGFPLHIGCHTRKRANKRTTVISSELLFINKITWSSDAIAIALLETELYSAFSNIIRQKVTLFHGQNIVIPAFSTALHLYNALMTNVR